MKGTAIKRFVLDTSIALAWCFEEEKTPYTESILDQLSRDAKAHVPAIWPLEVANALLVAERRKRITVAQAIHFLERLGGFAITVDETRLPRVFEHLFSKAREWKLTSYDAAYLELALRKDLPLATLDDDLKKAAHDLGVPIVHV